jgi:hypothetical protein
MNAPATLRRATTLLRAKVAHGNSQSGVVRSASHADASSPFLARRPITPADSHEVVGRTDCPRDACDPQLQTRCADAANGGGRSERVGRESTSTTARVRESAETGRESARRAMARVCETRGGASLRDARWRESASARRRPYKPGIFAPDFVLRASAPAGPDRAILPVLRSVRAEDESRSQAKSRRKNIRSRHTWIRYRCSLPGLAGFTSLRWRDHKPDGLTTTRNISHYTETGGEGGIRTRGALAGSHDFQSCTFDRSVTSPVTSIALRHQCTTLIRPSGERGIRTRGTL